MKMLTYRKVDAFTSDGSLGNPAACVYLKNEQALTKEEMLSIAIQHKGFVSEVVYCTDKGGLEYSLVYYSSYRFRQQRLWVLSIKKQYVGRQTYIP